MTKHSVSRWVGMLTLAVLVGPLMGCDQILKVDNPAEIGVDDLNTVELLDAQVAGVYSELADEMTRNNGALLWSVNFLTDEQVTGLNWEDYARVNQRINEYFRGPFASMWAGMSLIVRLGEEVTARIDSLVSPTDPRIALTQALAGYGYVFIGESMCSAVFSANGEFGDTEETPLQAFQRAVPAFERAIAVASATGQNDILNMARTGLARAYLNMADFPNTIQTAQAVTAGSAYWVEYSAAQDAENNGMFGNVHGTNHTMGVSPFFLQGTFGDQDLIDTQTDPRIQHSTRWTTGHNGLTKLYKPYQGLRYSGYSGKTQAPASPACPNCTGTVVQSGGDAGDILLYQKDTEVLLADYLEAQHHLMEARMRTGGNDAAVLAFVNARRAVGNEAPVNLGGAALFAELRRQRSLDLYQGGFRLGDLRRWGRDGVGDFFPSGNHVNQEWGAYGAWTCHPLPLSEYDGNPNLAQPANPLVPPPGW